MPVKGRFGPPRITHAGPHPSETLEIAMPPDPALTTARLCLRPWKTEDLRAFARLNADPRVMEFFPGVLDRAQSDAMAGRIAEHFDRHEFGLWAVEVINLAD